ncbi:uncharacterized protein LOC122372274 isoform X1 [Amphibalanus amphitrite]|uniref:uncharacterized protein LOC122372274 isoform X1 n=2 Tax=Amphibalanus amphitrite TaxID=1232801 RepID=UPI001C91ECBA|nr:uncharacterized protein LOC122372274 isoform X1 [Amphibalanus amphitrite]
METTLQEENDSCFATKTDNVFQSLIRDEDSLINWLQVCSAHGLVITKEYFYEEILHRLQLTTNGQVCADDVRQWLDGFCLRWADKLRSGPTGALLADNPPPTPTPASWYSAVSSAVAGRYPAVPLSGSDRLLHLAAANVLLHRRTAAVRRVRSDTDAAGAQRDNVAFLVAASADGERVPLMMLTPAGGLVRGDLRPEDNCLHLTTRNGTVTSDALRRYLCECLDPHLTERQVARPVLVFVDGRHHHASQELCRLCDDLGVVLIGLPPAAAARGPLRSAVAALLAANLTRMADAAQRGRRAEPDGGCSTSARALLAGYRTATRRASPQGIAHAFQWSGLSTWSESIISACGSGASAPDVAELQLPEPPPPPLTAPAGLTLPPDGASLEWAVRLLLSAERQRQQPAPLQPSQVPRPGPSSAAFLVSVPLSADGDGAAPDGPPLDTGDGWVTGSATVLSYLINESVFERVYSNQAGRLCLLESRRRELESLLTPSDRIVQVRRELSTWWNDTGRVRWVTRITGSAAQPAALYEFYLDDGRPPPPGSQATGAGEAAEERAGGDAKLAETDGQKDGAAEEDGVPADPAAPLVAVDVAPGSPGRGGRTSIPIPATGLPDAELLRLLIDPLLDSPALSRPPAEKEPNTAYLINNEANVQRRRRGAPCRYDDEPERWHGGPLKTGKLYTFLLDENEARRVCNSSRGPYSRPALRNGRWVPEPLNPPPTGRETEVQLRRLISRQMCGRLQHGGLLRRISWVEACEPPPARLPAVALYEYMSVEPRQRGNSVQVQPVNVADKREGDFGSELESDADSEPDMDESLKRAWSGQNGTGAEGSDVKRKRSWNPST